MVEAWEILDVDDSDLSSFVRPSKRQTLVPLPIDLSLTQTLNSTPFASTLKPCSLTQSLPRTPFSSTAGSGLDSRYPRSDSLPLLEASTSQQWRIPGPAGAVQAVMRRKARNVGNSERAEDGEEPVSTQEYIRRSVEYVGEDDDDFARNPWVCAVDFVRREGLFCGDDATIGTPLCFINRSCKDKVPQVVAVIKSCTPNGLGDLMVTLKDPTGTIDASIHRKVLAERDFGKEITVGAVLILQKVAVFSPARSVHYLNVTVNNVIKVISKDIESLSEYHLAKTVNHISALEERERLNPLNNSATKAKGTIDGILNSFRQGAKTREKIVNSEEPVAEKAPTPTLSSTQTEPGHGELHNDKNLEGISNLRAKNQQRGEGSSTGNGATSNMDRFSQSGGVMAAMSKDPCIEEQNHHKEALASTRITSHPQWTDEQLEQLLEYD